MGNTVTLHSACAYGDLSSVRRLLRTATPEQLEEKDDSGRTPLLTAVMAMKLRDELDDEFAELDDVFDGDRSDEIDPDKGAQAAGDGPAANGDEVVDEEEAGKESSDEQDESSGGAESEAEDVEEFTEDSMTEPLSKQAEILHLLLKQHANVDHSDENGWTALHHSCFVQNAVAIRMLIHAGAKPVRDSYGLLPQDLLQRGHTSEWIAQAQELKDTLDEITPKSPYNIKLLAFRPSGIVQLDMGGQVEKGSLVTIEYDVPEKHSIKDYIQVLLSDEDSMEIETGSYHYVPPGKHGQITISTKDIPSSSNIRFVYVKSDINTMSRQVVASGCNAIVQASVGEIFQYELFLYERVVEVESIPEFEFIDQPLIVLKRIGIVNGDEQIDWVTIRPDNHIVAVNDIRIDAMEFADAVRVLQENNGKHCTKLLMQNYSACGDFIPEKILGVGVIGKFAYLHPIDEGAEENVSEQQLDEWVNHSSGSEYESADEQVPQVSDGPVSTKSAPVQDEHGSPPPAPMEIIPDVLTIPMKMHADPIADEDPVNAVSEAKISASSTIETVVPLHDSFKLVAQLQHGISMSQAQG